MKVDRTGAALAREYSGKLLEYLEIYLSSGKLPDNAKKLESEILSKWENRQDSGGSTPESKSEEVFWFALFTLQRLIDPDKVKDRDGNSAINEPGYQQSVAKGLDIVVHCLKTGADLPLDHKAYRPPPWHT